MKKLALLSVLLSLSLSGCLTASAHLDYTDPKTGATAGIKIGEGSSGKSVKAGASFRANPKRVTLR